MNPIKYKLNSYDSLPCITQEKYEELRQQKKLLLFYNLVIDWSNFNHPGYNEVLEELQGKQISTHYSSKYHSYNADMIMCYRTIAKMQKNSQQNQGRLFYEKIYGSEKYQKHANVLEKINFSLPLMKQLEQLSVDELNILIQIPKIFQQPQKIRFKSTSLEQIWFSEYFWLSMSLFIIFIASTGAYMLQNYRLQQILAHSGYFLFGVIKWTVIQYFFHRFLFHTPIKDSKELRGHLIHHAFPNLNRKVAVSPSSLVIYLIGFLAFYKLFFQELQILMILNGLVSTLALYDILHYYCHFGPEINIKWVKFMRIYHLKHHYRNQNAYFGVTNPFWDYLFGTAPQNKLKQ